MLLTVYRHPVSPTLAKACTNTACMQSSTLRASIHELNSRATSAESICGVRGSCDWEASPETCCELAGMLCRSGTGDGKEGGDAEERAQDAGTSSHLRVINSDGGDITGRIPRGYGGAGRERRVGRADGRTAGRRDGAGRDRRELLRMPGRPAPCPAGPPSKGQPVTASRRAAAQFSGKTGGVR